MPLSLCAFFCAKHKNIVQFKPKSNEHFSTAGNATWTAKDFGKSAARDPDALNAPSIQNLPEGIYYNNLMPDKRGRPVHGMIAFMPCKITDTGDWSACIVPTCASREVDRPPPIFKMMAPNRPSFGAFGTGSRAMR